MRLQNAKFALEATGDGFEDLLKKGDMLDVNNAYNIVDRHYLRYRYQLEKYIHKMELREELRRNAEAFKEQDAVKRRAELAQRAENVMRLEKEIRALGGHVKEFAGRAATGGRRTLSHTQQPLNTLEPIIEEVGGFDV